LGEILEFKRREQEEPTSALDLLVRSWGQGDAELEEDIRENCGQLLEQYSAPPTLALELPVVDSLERGEQAELAEALCTQINDWAMEWHSRMLLEMLGSEIQRLRELHGYDS
jgi:hypothetical protein